MTHEVDGAAVSTVTDHPFEPDGDWFTRCKHCRLSEAAHQETTLKITPNSPPRLKLERLVRGLDLPKEGWVLGGSAILAVRNIRWIRDLDLYVDHKTYRDLKMTEKWVEWPPNPNDPVGFSRLPKIVRVEQEITCEASREWKHQGTPQRIDVQEFISEPEIVREFPCVPLHVLYEWKKIVGRPKDIQDVQLIEEWIARWPA